MKIEAGKFMFEIGRVNEAIHWFMQAVEMDDIEISIIDDVIEKFKDELIYKQFIEKLWNKFGNSGNMFLQIRLWQIGQQDDTLLRKLIDGVKSRTSKALDENEALMFGFALTKFGGIQGDEKIQNIISFNINVFQKFFPSLVPHGLAAPPKPVSMAPPAPVSRPSTQYNREAKRTLPGYTPGWLAEEYSKKHSI